VEVKTWENEGGSVLPDSEPSTAAVSPVVEAHAASGSTVEVPPAQGSVASVEARPVALEPVAPEPVAPEPAPVAVAPVVETELPEARVLLCTSIGPGKEYSAAFLMAAIRTLQGVAAVHVVLDGIPMPPELAALLPSETLVELPSPTEDWGALPAARTARAREAQRLAAIAGEYTHLYFHDADTIPPVDIIPRLLAHQEAVATGLYNMRGRSDVAVPVAPIPYSTWPPAWPGFAGLHSDGKGNYRAAHFGMGCFLIDQATLEKVPFITPEQCFARNIPEDVAWGADLAKVGGSVLVDPSLSCWHANGDGTANHLLVGGVESTAVWTDTPHFVSNRLGEWEAGVPHYGLSEEDLAALGAGFTTGHYPRLTVEVRRTEEIIPA
jgi:hypothetical protein